MNIFLPANILLPQVKDFTKWSVIACDQFTSQQDYWKQVYDKVGDAPSSLRLILPEVELDQNNEDRVNQINETMKQYLDQGIFQEYKGAYIYVERTLINGTIRKGVLGVIDLEAYDYHAASSSLIRATEKTVEERIPPRKKIRENALLELPHVLVLCNDEKKELIEPLVHVKDQLPLLYSFDLMAEGGHISGWLLQGEQLQAFEDRLQAYIKSVPEKYHGLTGAPVAFAIGDGNHSLASAKACYEDLKMQNPNLDFSHHPARYAMIELENIHDEAQQFEPIHRIMMDVDVNELLQTMKQEICKDHGYPIVCFYNNQKETLYLDESQGELAVGILQPFLDQYLKKHGGKIDYIHGDDVLENLSKQNNTLGILLPPMEKGQLFRGIVVDGVLPRKTFSMGHAQEKRYYLEARKIK